MQYTINQLYDHLYERVNNIYDTFKGFFGEGNVDLQGIEDEEVTKRAIINWLDTWGITQKEEGYYDIFDFTLRNLMEVMGSDRKVTIYVWWNRVTVTNEHGRYVNIQDLYAKVEITLEGRIPYENHGFLLNRATYNKEQFISNYMHSHVCDIPKSDFTRFQRPCLGTGPILGTIATLRNEYDEVTWMLFCEELALYVTVESIAGRPYNYLENITGNKTLLGGYKDFDFHNASPTRFYDKFSKEQLKEFIKYYIEKGHLSITYRNDKYTCGMSFYEYIIDISNAFIDFYNENQAKTKNDLNNMFTSSLLKKTLLLNGKFYINSSYAYSNLDEYRSKPVLRFRGKDITTTITEENETEATLTTVIDSSLAMFILKNILRTINFRYKNEYRYNTTGNNQETSSVNERVSYL